MITVLKMTPNIFATQTFLLVSHFNIKETCLQLIVLMTVKCLILRNTELRKVSPCVWVILYYWPTASQCLPALVMMNHSLRRIGIVTLVSNTLYILYHWDILVCTARTTWLTLMRSRKHLLWFYTISSCQGAYLCIQFMHILVLWAECPMDLWHHSVSAVHRTMHYAPLAPISQKPVRTYFFYLA